MPRATPRGPVPRPGIGIRLVKVLLVLPLVAIATAAIPPGARGESGIDLTANGYVVVQRTTVDGVFQGCERKLEIRLANGTTFDCAERNHHMAYRPKAVLLRNMRVRTYALIIDGRAYTGSLMALLGVPVQVPLPVAPPLLGSPDPPAGLTPGVDLPRYAIVPYMAKEPSIPPFPHGQAAPLPGQ